MCRMFRTNNQNWSAPSEDGAFLLLLSCRYPLQAEIYLKGEKGMSQIFYGNMKSRADGLKLSVMAVVPEAPYRGMIQLVHGMSEYKERYLLFMEYMAEQGFLSVIHDHRGHGESVRDEKDLGYMYGGGAEAFLDDIFLINETLRRRLPDTPLILFGHSMGSLAVRNFAKQHDDCMDALIVCGSPSNNPGRPLGKLLAGAAKCLFGGRHVCHAIETISFGPYTAHFAEEKSRFAWVCSDPKVVQDYAESPLCGFTFTADAYLVLFSLMKETYSLKGWRVSKPDLPVFFVGGGKDPCIGGRRKFAQAIRTMKQAGYRNVKGRLYPEMRHEILNETEKQKVYREIIHYLTKQGF